MNLTEINNQKWIVDKNLTINKMNTGSFGMTEQELHFNINDEEFIYVDCSSQTGITQLKKSEFFTLKDVLVSNKPKHEGFILSIKGIMEKKGLSIRKKKHIFTDEEKKIRSERAKVMFTKK